MQHEEAQDIFGSEIIDFFKDRRKGDDPAATAAANALDDEPTGERHTDTQAKYLTSVSMRENAFIGSNLIGSSYLLLVYIKHIVVMGTLTSLLHHRMTLLPGLQRQGDPMVLVMSKFLPRTDLLTITLMLLLISSACLPLICCQIYTFIHVTDVVLADVLLLLVIVMLVLAWK